MKIFLIHCLLFYCLLESTQRIEKVENEIGDRVTKIENDIAGL